MADVAATKGVADRAVARVLEARAVQPAPQSTTQASTPPTAAPDVARLSGVATELAARPPVDGERVQQIRRAIANGTFPILPATVADRLLAARYEWMNDDAA